MNLDNLNWKDSEVVLINNTETSVIIEDVSDVLNYYADKYLITKYPIKTGDMCEYNGIIYIIISQIDRNKDNFKARIRQADFNIKFNFDNEIKEFPVIIESKVFDIVEGRYITLQNSKILVTLKDDIETTYIIEGKRFIKMGKAWKIVGIDKTRPGLLILNCDVDQFNTDDDKENEIADYVPPTEPEPPVGDYTIEIAGETEIRLGETKTYTATVKNNGAIVEGKAVKWTIENKSSLTIVTTMDTTDNSITLKASEKFDDMGEFKLVAKLVDDETVTAERWIEVIGLW